MVRMLNESAGGLSRRGFLKVGAAAGIGVSSAYWLAACGQDAGADAEQARLGWIQPSTGRLAAAYAPVYVAAEIAMQEIKAAGGLLGEQIDVLKQDDEGSPATQAKVAQRMLRDRPHFVLGPTGSSQAVASATALGRGSVIQSAWGGADVLGDGTRFPFHYLLVYSTAIQGQAAAKFLYEQQGMRKIGLLVENSEFGEAIQESFVAALQKEFRTKPVAVEVFDPEAPDMAPYVRKLARAGVDGLGMFSGQPQANVLSLRTMADIDFAPAIVVHDLNFLDAYDELPKALLERYYGTTYRALTYEKGGKPNGPSVEYAKKIRAHPEVGELVYSAATSPYYDFLKLLAVVVEQEKTVDPAKLKGALDRVRGYQGVRGTVSFTEENHRGIGRESIAIATLLSAKDEVSMGGIFRELAT